MSQKIILLKIGLFNKHIVSSSDAVVRTLTEFTAFYMHQKGKKC